MTGGAVGSAIDKVRRLAEALDADDFAIDDQPVAGQRERLDAFMDRHGLRRP